MTLHPLGCKLIPFNFPHVYNKDVFCFVFSPHNYTDSLYLTIKALENAAFQGSWPSYWLPVKDCTASHSFHLAEKTWPSLLVSPLSQTLYTYCSQVSAINYVKIERGDSLMGVFTKYSSSLVKYCLWEHFAMSGVVSLCVLFTTWILTMEERHLTRWMLTVSDSSALWRIKSPNSLWCLISLLFFRTVRSETRPHAAGFCLSTMLKSDGFLQWGWIYCCDHSSCQMCHRSKTGYNSRNINRCR